MPTAISPVILGHHGEIKAGEEIPDTFLDTLGNECKTDFARLEELGVIEARKVERAVRRATQKG